VEYSIHLRAGGAHGGGGGHSSGGSSSSHSSGSSYSSGGAGGSLGGIILLVAIIVVVMVVKAAIKNRRPSSGFAAWSRAQGDGPGGTAPAAVMDDAAVKAGIDAITAHDPGFTVDAFLVRAEKVFFIVQQGWMDQKPGLTRQVMADGLWQQHKVQIEQYVNLGHRNILENLTVRSKTVVEASSDQCIDTIKVRFRAACADYNLDVKSGKLIWGSHDIEEWGEDWLFQRSAKAVTPAGGGAAEGRCPHCSAPIDVADDGTCRYCNQPISGGAYDWVLARIDQLQGAGS
jgi:predicted lipid-binding transport protein (Tim44 family)